VQESVSSRTAKIEIGQPRLFTLGAVLIVTAYGAVLAVPFVIAIMVVSVLKLGIMTVLIPAVAIAWAALFLPFGRGNPYVAHLVRALKPVGAKPFEGFVVQVIVSPRIRSGLRALLEDADDIGYLSFTNSELLFQGDSISLSAPYDCIKEVRPPNAGLRGPFVGGQRIAVIVAGLPNVTSLEFAERSSWLLPTSRRITKQLHQHLLQQ
jgi:hypothetical protein